MIDETPLLFGPARSQVGVLNAPSVNAPEMAVIFINAGLIHHVGPNRLHV